MHHHHSRILVGLTAAVLAIGLSTAVASAADGDPACMTRENRTPAHQDVTVFLLLGTAMTCAAGCAAMLSK